MEILQKTDFIVKHVSNDLISHLDCYFDSVKEAASYIALYLVEKFLPINAEFHA